MMMSAIDTKDAIVDENVRQIPGVGRDRADVPRIEIDVGSVREIETEIGVVGRGPAMAAIVSTVRLATPNLLFRVTRASKSQLCI